MTNLSEAYRRKTGGRRRASRVVDNDYYALEGGLNRETAPLHVSPGECLTTKNYEHGVKGGYRRIDGFERFDGKLAPSKAPYTILNWDGGTLANYPVLGDTVVGNTSAAQGVLKVINVGESEQDDGFASGFSNGFGGQGDLGFMVLVAVTGTFVDGENLSVSSIVFGVMNGAPSTSALEQANHEAWSQLAADDQRLNILKVPGSGRIRGVWFYRGNVYAFRDNAAATAVVMHKSTPTGWSAVTLNDKILFTSGGTTEIQEGDTITGATSAATATVERVGRNGGTWGAGDASGFMILSGVSGTFTSGDGLLVSAVNLATANGANFTQTLTVGGRYEFRTNNFYGHSDKQRMYGASGVDPCLEYDDSGSGVFSQISTGMPTDTPSHLATHLDRLVLMFKGGSLQLSGSGAPDDWLVVLGALELATGGVGTGLLEEIGEAGNQALFAFNRNETYVLTGNSTSSWELIKFGRETGALEWTMSRIGKGVFLDDRGFTTLTAVQAYGNFQANTFSEKIQTLLNSVRNLAVDSHIRRDRNLYRCAFSDGSILSVGFKDKKVTGIMSISFDDKVMRCSCSEEDTNGVERTFFGSDDGYIYEMSEGIRDFDGQPIEAFIRLAFHHSKSPSRFKRYRRAAIGIVTESRVTVIKGQVDYSYADPDYNFQPQSNLDVPGGGGFWDVGNWGEFQWDAGINQEASFKLEGSGVNIGFGFYQNTRDELPHTLYDVTLHYSPRRLNRSTNV